MNRGLQVNLLDSPLTLFIHEMADQVNDIELAKVLQQSPQQISDFYDRQLCRVKLHKLGERAIEIIRYVGIAKRPLGKEEMREILSIEQGDHELGLVVTNDEIDAIIEACCGLIRIDKHDGTLHYIHSSLHSYLFSETETARTEFQNQLLDARFGTLCMKYLKAHNLREQSSGSSDISLAKSGRSEPVHPTYTSLDSLDSPKTSPTSALRNVPSHSIIRSQANPTSVTILPIEHGTAFLSYARTYWYQHLAEINPTDDAEAWRLFDDCLQSTDVSTVKPWDDIAKKEAGATVEAGTILEWAISERHYALVYHQVFSDQSVVSSESKQSTLRWLIDCFTQPSQKHARLLEHISPDHLDKHQTILHEAVLRKNSVAVDQLAKPETINAVDCNGMTPLHYALRRGFNEMAEILLARGADINATTTKGWSPLHFASKGRHTSLVQMLLDAGADVNKTTVDGWAPLHRALNSGRIDIAQKLLVAGSDVNATDFDGWTPLHLSARYRFVGMTQEIPARGADINAVAADKRTPLHIALNDGHADLVETLIAAGVNVNAADSDGVTCLHLALKNGRMDIADELLVAGADVNAATEEGWTPLHFIACSTHIDMVTKLLTAGADGNATTLTGETPLHLTAGYIGVDIAARLLATGADIEAKNLRGRTALHYAANSGQAEMAKFLVAAGADVDSVTRDGHTPLHFAASWASSHLTRVLLDAGAVPCVKARDGRIPLDVAEASYGTEVATLLRAHTASLEEKACE